MLIFIEFIEFRNLMTLIESRNKQFDNKINSRTIYVMLIKWIKIYLLLKI